MLRETFLIECYLNKFLYRKDANGHKKILMASINDVVVEMTTLHAIG